MQVKDVRKAPMNGAIASTAGNRLTRTACQSAASDSAVQARYRPDRRGARRSRVLQHRRQSPLLSLPDGFAQSQPVWL